LEGIIRITFFLSILVLMICWEVYAPRRKLIYPRGQRWTTNISLSVLNILFVRLTVGAAAFVAATTAFDHGWGILNSVDLPSWLTIIITLVVLDLAIYGQHVASHHWRWLWRLHKIHHTDLDFDVTTAVRFHPIEIALSMCFKVILIFILGADPIAVIAFEIILSSCALFNHSNIYMPKQSDTLLRLLLVTPDMHRVHHSVIPAETNSNYGFSISVWDRLFDTYTDEPTAGHTNMIIGLADYQQIDNIVLHRLLLMPLNSDKDV